jgi:hypothetical protein
MTDFKYKYFKYKTKYLNTQTKTGGGCSSGSGGIDCSRICGGGKTDIVILHSPNPMYTRDEIIEHYGRMVGDIEKLGNVKHYFFKFGTIETNFKLKSILFENASHNIHKWFNKNGISNAIIICIEEASPFGLYFANEYPEKCHTIICYPLRLYTKESLERSIWKFRDQKGWDKYMSDKYSLDDYLLNINEERFSEILSKKHNQNEKGIMYQIYNHELRKQYDKIPKVYKTKTHLFSRLDLDAITTIEANFERKAIADIKGYMSANDALYGSMIWNFARTKYDDELLKLNSDNNNLRIHYYVGAFKLGHFGGQADMDLLDCIQLILYKVKS